MISVIIPARNAHALIGPCLGSLVSAAVAGFVREVIIVDGGSDTGEMAKVADAAGARFVKTQAGRGLQLAAGADIAKGPWLMFLHADTVLEDGWQRAVDQFITNTQQQAGHGVPAHAAAFRFGVDDKGVMPALLTTLVRMRGKLFGLPYGDQGLIINKRHYEALGGFSPLPLMEDVEFVRRIGARKMSILTATAYTDASKYRRDGYVRRSAKNLWLLLRYFMGANPEKLAARYR